MKITYEDACAALDGKEQDGFNFESWEKYIESCGFDCIQESYIYASLSPKWNRVTKEEFEIAIKTHYSSDTMNKLLNLFRYNRTGLLSAKELEENKTLIILEN